MKVVVVLAALIASAYAAVDATGYFLKDAAANDGAQCLDGTPGAYYHRPGKDSGANKWYIHHQGGGWCESLTDCRGRANGDLGSSKAYPKDADLGGGYFSTDPKENPQMYNWNSVFLRYCDGGSFSGSNSSTTMVQGMELHWRGKHILKAMIDDLLNNRGLAKATDIVISGCSAGGLATYLHVDHWASRMPTGAKVRGMPDSGFFMDYQGPPAYQSGMQWLFYQMNSTSGVNERCISAHQSTHDTQKCIFAQHTAPHIQTPIFPLQAEYDSWQIGNDLGVPTSNVATINEWGKNLTTIFQQTVLNRPQNSAFLDSCLHHCGEWQSIRIDGTLSAQAFQQWYEGTSSARYIQGKPYECADCCKP
jgi:hypothetical protein